MRNKVRIAMLAMALAAGLTACGNSNIKDTSGFDAAASTKDTVSQVNTETEDSQVNATVSAADPNKITEAQAKQAALSHAGLTEADITFINIQLDTDDGTAVNGRQEYEVEFYSGNTEYDYEIDAADGTILEWSVESVYDD